VSGRAIVCALVALAWPCVLLGQTCTITSPTSGQFFQSPQALQLSATVASAPTAYKLIWSVDYLRWATGFVKPDPGIPNDYRDSYQGPFTVNWYTGLNGDGPHTVSGILYDIFGNVLATCPTVSFTVRIEGMSNQSINAMPNLSGNTVSGTGTFGFLTWDGNPYQSGNSSFAVDGMILSQACGFSSATSQTGGWKIPNSNTACYPNGTRQIYAAYSLGGITGEPYLLTSTITSTGSGTTLTASSAPYVVNGSIVTFSNSGGSLPAPLNAGTQCYWQAGTGSCIASVTISAGVMTFTTSVANGLTTNGTPVFIRNIQSTNQTTGLPNCDGYYTNTTFISATSFSVPAPPGCPNGAAGPNNLEVDVNPYFAIYSGSGNTFSVSATATAPTSPAQYGTWTPGTAVTFTNAGSGTQTALQRIRSPYWTGYSTAGGLSGGDYVTQGAQAYVNTQVTFSNGATPMEMEVPFWEYHGWTGKTGDTLCPKIKNTDLSLTTVSCSSFTYSVTSDGPTSGAISVNSSTGALTYTSTVGWAQGVVSCASCGPFGLPLSVTTYIQNHGGSSSAAVTFPHFTTCGPIATTFQTGSCHSFLPSGMLQLDVTQATNYHAQQQPWIGPMMQAAGLNSANTGLGPGVGPGTSGTQSTCPNWSSTTTALGYAEGFASTNGISLEFDTSGMWAAGNSGTAPILALATILGNVQYNRQACVTAFVVHQVAMQLYWRNFSDDEEPLDLGLGAHLMPNPLIGGANCTLLACLTSITVSGSGLTFNMSNPPNLAGNWSQSAGTGSWVEIVDATNTCLNGWYPILSTTSTTWTSNNNGSCANGTYEPSGGTSEATAQIVINPMDFGGSGNSQQNCSPLPTTLPITYNDSQQGWKGTYYGVCAGANLGSFDQISTTATASSGSTSLTVASAPGITVGQAVFGSGIASGTTVSNVSGTTVTLSLSATSSLSGTAVSFSNLVSIVVSGSLATVNYLAHNIPIGTAIRISGATTSNLNILAVVNSSGYGTNAFTITYAGTTGEVAPSAGTYNFATDPNLFITVDPNWGPNPLGQFNSLIGNVANHPARVYPILGSNFNTSQLPTVVSYQGNSAIAESSFVYNQGNPPLIYGTDMSVWGAANYATLAASGNGGGLATRAYQLKPRTIYWGDGFIDAGNTVQYCRSFNFNPGCDRPAQLGWRPEETIAQMMGMKDLDIAGFRGYNFTQNMTTYYSIFCCGWQTRGSGNGNGMNPWNNPKQWAAMARVNALLTLREDTELQPEANKPYMGPYFVTDAHTNATYGNELDILCASESPYGAQTVTLPAISGGSMLKYVLTAYSLSVTQMSGNPTTDTAEYCASAGMTTTYVAQPPGHNVLDNITFAPPAPLPFGASKFLIQVGYFPSAMQDDPVTDCTSICTIGIDHHDAPAYYRVIYADSNNLPRSIGDPMKIPSQGLY
jgi:hypothetical protein